LRWSQDGLLVGFWRDESVDRQTAEAESDNKIRRNRLFDLVPIPGLNAADLDLRDQARIALNVQRDDFLRDATGGRPSVVYL
jgi:hypothetical protein